MLEEEAQDGAGLELLSTRVPKKCAETNLHTPYHGDAFIGRTVPCVFVLVLFPRCT
jgi:hypothetical protein